MNNEHGPHIRCDFPGGNIEVESVDENEVLLRPDLRDTEGHWFYWYFAATAPAGRRVSFRFTETPAIGSRGPAVSRDDGRSWRWLGDEKWTGEAFGYVFPDDGAEVRFSMGMPYLERDLDRFLAQHAGNPRLRRERLCRSKAGRDVELLRVGAPASEARGRVLMTCRHHACEMMANYVLEGCMEHFISAEDGASDAQNVELIAVPFVDKDGVEEGDQGKNRRPRDHNRDYAGTSLYPETSALRERMKGRHGDALRVALDLHCPYIREDRNNMVYLVGLPDEQLWEQQVAFGETLEAQLQGSIPYEARNNLPFGEDWNTTESYKEGKCFARWAGEVKSVELASTIEIPYADAQGREVNAETARAFGRDLGRALVMYLTER